MLTNFSLLNSNAYTTFVLRQLVPAVVIFFVGWFLAGKLTAMIKAAMEKYKLDESIVSFSNSLFKVVFRGIVILMVATCFGVNVSSIIAALGAALVTVGLALKDNLANAASGVIIITNKPFKIGDALETSEVKGRVEKIEMLFTTLSTPENKEIVIPNSKLTSNYVVTASAHAKRCLVITVPIKKTTKLADIQPLLDGIIKNQENLLAEPPASISIDSFDDETVTILVSVWCEAKNYSSLEKELRGRIKTELDANNIDF